ncbi:MAG: hypothetical protein H7263_06825 [Candidatus Sericytochromatia bacterium]|nr:hypothetical protein [Candidatus Sericytochromatia bacterium]
MKNLSKVILTSISLAVLLSSCNGSPNSTTSINPINDQIVNKPEISAFAAESAKILSLEYDKNKNDQISKTDAGITDLEMRKLDKNGDGKLSQNEIATGIKDEYNNASKVSDALGSLANLNQPFQGNIPTKPPISTFKPNKISLYIDRDEILPMMFNAIDNAKKTIQMDLYLLGGKIGLQIAQKLVEKARQGVDIKLTFDPNLGFSGPTQQEVYMVVDYLRQNKVEFKLYPLHLIPKVEEGLLKNKFQIDHDKMTVIDGNILITGGFNLFDLGVGNRDLMYKIEGVTAQEASNLLSYEWLLSDKFIDKKPPATVYVVKDVKDDTGTDAMAKIVKTAPYESTTKPALIEMINNAQQSVYLSVLEFSDLDVTAALVRAYKRGVDVKVLMDRKDTNDKYAGGIPVPNYYPNILPARELVKNLVPTRWYDARYPGQELHMKMCVVDGNKMIAGSTNFTRQAFTTFRETSIQVEGGSAPPKMVRTFLEDWTGHATAIKKITLGDKIRAKVVEFLDNRYYAWW